MTAWVNLAHKISLRSTHPQHRLGAVIIRGGSVLATAANTERWHHHAERRALNACADPSGATLVVARSTGGRLAKPCPACEIALRAAGIARVIYTTEAGFDVSLY